MFVCFFLIIGPRLVMFKLENHSSHSFQMMCTVVGMKNFAVQICKVCFMNINKTLQKQIHLYMMMEWKVSPESSELHGGPGLIPTWLTSVQLERKLHFKRCLLFNGSLLIVKIALLESSSYLILIT